MALSRRKLFGNAGKHSYNRAHLFDLPPVPSCPLRILHTAAGRVVVRPFASLPPRRQGMSFYSFSSRRPKASLADRPSSTPRNPCCWACAGAPSYASESSLLKRLQLCIPSFIQSRFTFVRVLGNSGILCPTETIALHTFIYPIAPRFRLRSWKFRHSLGSAGARKMLFSHRIIATSLALPTPLNAPCGRFAGGNCISPACPPLLKVVLPRRNRRLVVRACPFTRFRPILFCLVCIFHIAAVGRCQSRFAPLALLGVPCPGTVLQIKDLDGAPSTPRNPRCWACAGAPVQSYF